MRKLLISGLFLSLLLVACDQHVVRDTEVYKTELNLYNSWATHQAELLRKFVTAHCTCTEAGTFIEKDCEVSADWLLTVEARHEWHKGMSLYNAGLLEERPAKEPPVIPLSTCPLPAAPTTEAVEEGGK